jgi:serine/threonine protein kinase
MFPAPPPSHPTTNQQNHQNNNTVAPPPPLIDTKNVTTNNSNNSTSTTSTSISTATTTHTNKPSVTIIIAPPTTTTTKTNSNTTSKEITSPRTAGGGSSTPPTPSSLTNNNNNEPRHSSNRSTSVTSTSGRPIHSVLSTESLPDKGRQLLQTFDKARTDFATKYGGDDEVATVAFCQQILARGAPELSAKYEVVHSVSCGTTSVVCHAVPRNPSKTTSAVAIKFARLVFTPNDRTGISERKRQFEIEAKLMRRCSSPHVVELLDFKSCVEGFAIFVMEYLPKTLLEHTVESNERGAHHELQAAKHIRSIAAALATCHSLSIAHLDVKLDNVLCTANGEAKLCDFGLADISPVRRSAATPLYAPPEILTIGRADDKSDMWSLGVVAYILLAGYPPFQPDNEHELRDNIINARYSFPLAEGWGEVSPLARDLVSKLLILDSRERYSAVQVLNHPWIVAAAAAPSIPQTPPRPTVTASINNNTKYLQQTGPPMLKRADSIVNLERMAHRSLIEKQQSRLRSLSQFREFAEDIRRGWTEGGWQGVAAVGREDPGISSLVEVASDLKRGWQENGLKGARMALSQSRSKLRATFLSDKCATGQLEEENEEEEEIDAGLLNELHSGWNDSGKSNTTNQSTTAALTTTTSTAATATTMDDGISTTTTTKDDLLSEEGGDSFSVGRQISTTTDGSSISQQQQQLHSNQSSSNSQQFINENNESATTTTTTDKSHTGTNPLALDPFDDKAFLRTFYGSIDLREAPKWIPDSEAVACRLCLAPFTFFHRRHHCRHCGQVVCDQCSKPRLVVKFVDPVKPVRVCILCRDGIA